MLLTVGWVCALPHELAASQAMLDETYTTSSRQVADNNIYTFGRIGEHDIVMTCLPAGNYGTEAAATAVRDLVRTFNSLQFGLLVGIGAGVPSSRHDIQLGDVVVSKPAHSHGGVIQYDHGKTHSHKFERRSHLNKPPALLLSALNSLQALHEVRGANLLQHVAQMLQLNPSMSSEYARPRREAASHPESFGTVGHSQMCRPRESPAIHYGLIATGNRAIADAAERDRLSAADDVLCFEMQAGGLMDSDLSFLVIRGICNLADSSKSDSWQRHAAAVAAAYGKSLLAVIPKSNTDEPDIISTSSKEPRIIFGDIKLTPNFVQRPFEMKQIERFLSPSFNGGNLLRRRMCILHGLGGIGKTQLAIKFAHDHQARFNSTILINGASDLSIKQSFRDFLIRVISSNSQDTNGAGSAATSVSAMDDRTVRERVHAWLSDERNREWLLIFDNVDLEKGHPQAYDLEYYLPSDPFGAVLVTSRLKSLKRLAPSIEIRNMSDEQSLKVIRNQKKAGDANSARFENVQDTLSRLQGLPLALALAGSYMADTGCSFADYLEMYDSQWHDLIEEQDEDSLPGYDRPMLQTWSISYDQAARKNPASTKLLDLAAFLGNDFLHYDVLNMKVEDPDESPIWPAWLEKLARSRLQFHRAIRLLYRLSLISTNDRGKTFAIHSVVHRWCFQRLLSSDLKTCQEMCKMALSLLARNIRFDKPGEEYMWRSRHLFPGHISQLLQRLDQCSTIDGASSLPVSSLRDLFILGQCMIEHGRLRDGEQLFEKSLAGMERHADLPISEKVKVLGQLGLTYSALGKLGKGKALLESTLPMIESALGPKSEATLNHVHRLGIACAQLYQLPLAESMYLRAMAGFEEICGPDGPLTLHVAASYGILCYRNHRFEDAEKLLNRALGGYEKLGLDCRDTLIIDMILNIGVLRMMQERYQESETMLVRALDLCKTLIGGNEEEAIVPLVMILHNLGLIYYKQALYADAQSAFERALEASRRVYGPLSHWTLDTIFYLGLCQSKQGHTANAAQVFGWAQTGLERGLQECEPDVWITVAMMSKLGQVYAQQGRRSDAEKMLARGRESAKALRARRMGMGNVDTDKLEALEESILRMSV